MAEQKPCPFCNLDQERNRVICDTGVVLVILSNPRLMPGHTLVIPREHAGAIFELSPFAQQQLILTALSFQKRMIEIFSWIWDKPAGCDLSIHTRPFMPRTQLSIPGHAHIHLRPRHWEDAYYEKVLKHETDFFQVPVDEELAHYQRILSLPE